MAQGVLYGERAALYDVIYAWKDYAAEAERLHARLLAEGVPDGARVAEVACGTGKHLAELRRWYAVSGSDASADMLAVARTRLPDVPLTRADMRDPQAGEPVDALLCLFSSIGYLHGRDALEAALRAFAAALRPGGVLIVEPWVRPEAFRPHRATSQHTDAPGLVVTRTSYGRVEGELAVLDFHWLVGRDGAGVEHFVETHALWLCPAETMAAALDAAGFDARYDDDGLMPGRGLWVGRRR